MSKTILILAAGPLQLPAILTAKSMGHRVVVADGNPGAVGLQYADLPVVIDIRNPKECLKIAQREKIAGVLAICSEVSLKGIALINETMGLFGVNSEQIERSTNKVRMREAFKQNGVPSPESYQCRTIEDAILAAKSLGENIIIKPSIAMGSRGIFHLRSHLGLVEAFQRAKSISKNGEVLVEEFVDGPEFSVETLTWNKHTEVIAITDKITTGSPYWVEMGHTQPSEFPENVQSKLKKITIAGINALGLDWCAGHTEIKLSSKGPSIIEIGPRLGGDFITTELTPRSTGVDIVEGAIKIALGEQPLINRFAIPKGVAIRYLAGEPGHLAEINNLN